MVSLQLQEKSIAEAEIAGEPQIGVGGDGPRLPSTISLMRRGGTPMARASAVCVNDIGLRKSCKRISPGCGFGKRSAMVFDDLGISRDLRRSCRTVTQGAFRIAP